MPSEESRRLLKAFGIAVTDLEDALQKGATKEELARADAEVSARLAQGPRPHRAAASAGEVAPRPPFRGGCQGRGERTGRAAVYASSRSVVMSREIEGEHGGSC